MKLTVSRSLIVKIIGQHRMGVFNYSGELVWKISGWNNILHFYNLHPYSM